MVKLRNSPPCKDAQQSAQDDSEVIDQPQLISSTNSQAVMQRKPQARQQISPSVAALGTKIGARYSPSAACWDSNRNGQCENTEDRSADGMCSVDDCLSVNLKELCAALADSGITVKSCG